MEYITKNLTLPDQTALEPQHPPLVQSQLHGMGSLKGRGSLKCWMNMEGKKEKNLKNMRVS